MCIAENTIQINLTCLCDSRHSSKHCFQWRSEVRGQTELGTSEWRCRSWCQRFIWHSIRALAPVPPLLAGVLMASQKYLYSVITEKTREKHLAGVRLPEICWKSRNEMTAVPLDPRRRKTTRFIAANWHSYCVCMGFRWGQILSDQRITQAHSRQEIIHVPALIIRWCYSKRLLIKSSWSLFTVILTECYYSKTTGVLWP